MSDGIASSVDFLGYWLDDRGMCGSIYDMCKGLSKLLLKAAAESDT
jgi:hypothetical protein